MGELEAKKSNLRCHYRKYKLPSWKSTVKFHGNVAEYSTGTLTTSTLLALVTQEHTERFSNPNRPLYPHP